MNAKEVRRISETAVENSKLSFKYVIELIEVRAAMGVFSLYVENNFKDDVKQKLIDLGFIVSETSDNKYKLITW